MGLPPEDFSKLGSTDPYDPIRTGSVKRAVRNDTLSGSAARAFDARTCTSEHPAPSREQMSGSVRSRQRKWRKNRVIARRVLKRACQRPPENVSCDVLVAGALYSPLLHTAENIH